MKIFIRERRWLGEEKFILLTSKPAGFQFYPGQFVLIEAMIKGEKVRRAYTLASHPDENFLMFFIHRLPKGKMSNYLAQRKKGQSLTISAAQGVHHSGRFQDLPRITYLVAGCGIAGVRSLVLEFKKKKQQTVVHQERYARALPWQDILRRYSRYYPVLSREKRVGALFGHLEDFLQRWLTEETVYYLVGSPAFVEEISQAIQEAGLKRIDLHQESY